MKISTKDLVLCALFTALICVLAPISIPLGGGVPISLATFAVMLSGVLLGAKWGTVSALIYLLLGAFGVPVFSSYSGGLSHLASSTGGYIVGYLLLAFCCGFFYDTFAKKNNGAKKIAFMVLGMVIGTLFLYLLGTVWFCLISGTAPLAALSVCVLPFLIGDAIKIVVVCLVAPQIERALKKAAPASAI